MSPKKCFHHKTIFTTNSECFHLKIRFQPSSTIFNPFHCFQPSFFISATICKRQDIQFLLNAKINILYLFFSFLIIVIWFWGNQYISALLDFLVVYYTGHPHSADLRYWDEDTISPSTLIFTVRKGSFRIYILFISPWCTQEVSYEMKLKWEC